MAAQMRVVLYLLLLYLQDINAQFMGTNPATDMGNPSLQTFSHSNGYPHAQSVFSMPMPLQARLQPSTGVSLASYALSNSKLLAAASRPRSSPQPILSPSLAHILTKPYLPPTSFERGNKCNSPLLPIGYGNVPFPLLENEQRKSMYAPSSPVYSAYSLHAQQPSLKEPVPVLQRSQFINPPVTYPSFYPIPNTKCGSCCEKNDPKSTKLKMLLPLLIDILKDCNEGNNCGKPCNCGCSCSLNNRGPVNNANNYEVTTENLPKPTIFNNEVISQDVINLEKQINDKFNDDDKSRTTSEVNSGSENKFQETGYVNVTENNTILI